GREAWSSLLATDLLGWPLVAVPAVALATAPTLALWLRDSLRTLWASLVFPIAAYVAFSIFGAVVLGMPFRPPGGLLLTLYCGGMLLLGFRRFLTLEVTGSVHPTTMRRRDRTARPAASLRPRSVHKLRSLAAKEVRLQRATLLLIPIALAGWLAFWLLAARSGRFDAELAILGWIAAMVLLVAVPALLGASAVAAERQLGVLGWQMGQPISHRLQWLVKIGVGLLFTVLSGGLGLYFVDLWGTRSDLAASMPPVEALWPFLAFLIGLCGSRHGKTPFQALGLSLLFGAGLWYAWRILGHTSSIAAVFWPYTYQPLLQSFERYGSLIDLFTVLLLCGLAWTVPRRADWISGGKLGRSRISAALLLLVLFTFGTQATILSQTTSELEQEVAAKDAEITTLGGTSRLDSLRQELGLSVDKSQPEDLTPIIDLHTFFVITGRDGSGQPDLQQAIAARQPISRFMMLSAWLDGIDTESHWLDRWYWTRTSLGFLYTAEFHKAGVRFHPQRGVPGPASPFSLAPWWRQGERRQQLDRRVRQNVLLEAKRASQQLEARFAEDPEQFRKMVRRSTAHIPTLAR
ncbi:MAG: hypothetical protein AAF657_34975, partial [Acidobacteriota bacterium]